MHYHAGTSNGPYFMFPDDHNIKGSSELTHVLIKTLGIHLNTYIYPLHFDISVYVAKKGLVGIVTFQRSKSSTPTLAMLLPQLEVISDVDGCQEHPEGFHVITLPYCDDLRTNPYGSKG